MRYLQINTVNNVLLHLRRIISIFLIFIKSCSVFWSYLTSVSSFPNVWILCQLNPMHLWSYTPGYRLPTLIVFAHNEKLTPMPPSIILNWSHNIILISSKNIWHCCLNPQSQLWHKRHSGSSNNNLLSAVVLLMWVCHSHST